MALDRPKVFRPFALAGLLGLAAIGSAPRAMAQDHTPDPYKPYNAAYDSFVYPTYPNSYGLVPNQGILQGRAGYSGANRFQDFIDGGDYGDAPFSPRRTGPGVPYYSAYRRYDRDYDRVYQPNKDVDETYYKDQQARHDKYLEYLREKDPRRRAELLREYTQQSQRVARDLAGSRNSLSRAGSGSSSASRTPAAPGQGRGTSAAGTGRNPLTGADRTPQTGAGRNPLTGAERTPLGSTGRSTTRGSSPTSPRSSLFPSRSTRPATPSDILRRSNEEFGTPSRSRTRTTPGLGPATGSPSR